MFYGYEYSGKQNQFRLHSKSSDGKSLTDQFPLRGKLFFPETVDRLFRRFSFARFPQEDKAVSIPKRIGVPAFPVNSHRDETPTPVELSTDKWITTKASETSRRASCKRDCISDKSETDSLSFLCNNFFKEKLFLFITFRSLCIEMPE